MSNTPKTKKVIPHVPRSVYFNKLAHGIVSVIFIYASLWLIGRYKVLPDSESKQAPESLESRFTLLLKWLPVTSVTLYITVIKVIEARAMTPAIDPMSGYEQLVESRVRQLTNTLEQLVLLIFAQLSLIVRLSYTELSILVPYSSSVFVVTRITYCLGYPHQRAFGFITSFLIITAFYGFSLLHLLNPTTANHIMHATLAHFKLV